MEVDIAGYWVKGRHRAESGLSESSENNFQSIQNDGAPILKPCGSRVGVSHTEYDWSLVEDEVLEDDSSVKTIDDLIPVPASIVDPIVMVDGKSLHKATVISQMLSTECVSGDRLKRVQGFSNVEPNSVTGKGSLAETFVVGDPLWTLGDQNLSSIIIITSLICDAKEQRWIPAEKLKDSTIRG